MKKELVTQQDPKSPISEIFRTLRTNIQFMNTKGRLKSILITSTLPGEGKSWVASNLAVTFAQAGKKVILIDADMRKGRVYSIFGVSPRPGLSNYLSGIYDNEDASNDLADYIQETDIENLYVISAGNVPPNPSELLITDQMIDLKAKLEEICDIIIFDGTPSQLVTDSLILARIVDSTVIVTASKLTKKEDLKRVINNIKNVGGKIAGVVVNKLEIDSKKYEQSYYYGSTAIAETKPKTRTAKRASKEMYNRASNIIEKRDVTELKTKETKITDNKETNELPKALKRNIKIENAEEVSEEKTKQILEQMNQYLDQEKKKLN